MHSPLLLLVALGSAMVGIARIYDIPSIPSSNLTDSPLPPQPMTIPRKASLACDRHPPNVRDRYDQLLAELVAQLSGCSFVQEHDRDLVCALTVPGSGGQVATSVLDVAAYLERALSLNRQISASAFGLHASTCPAHDYRDEYKDEYPAITSMRGHARPPPPGAKAYRSATI
ncbi:hypothetical protein B0T22DRAFT_127684 [Podospora appendiculata]|uniref:Ecp2 effector protein domain-containing protein n=1 Tax=Podospora appendiculata TaxID=314037 RepID=A0AAE0X7D4_9PEZI|nr:hypothetical protein B0T22DRAFT_127684 [Podospora appendiculata]